MTERRIGVDWVLFFVLGVCWGSSYLFIKIGVETISPFTLIAGRLGIGALLLAGVVVATRTPLPRDPRIYRHLVVMGFINIVVPFALITWAEQSVPSALGAILTAVVPLFTIVIAALFLHDEPITVNRLAGLVIGFVGVFVLVSRSLGGGGESSFVGEIALVLAAACYAIGNVYTRRNVRTLSPILAAFLQVTIAFAVSALLAVGLEQPWTQRPTVDGLLAVVWLGLLGSGFAYLINFRLISRWGSTRSSLVAYLLPVVGIVLGFLVLHETVDARVLVGTGLIIAGVALVNSRYGRRRLYGRAPVPEAGAQVGQGVR